jgi:adenylate kinase family enzyme
MIILINGSINSGKSTIAKILSDKIPNTAVLEIDTLREFIKDVPLEKAIPINLENAISLITNFVKHNFNVIVPYPLSRQNYDFLVKGFKKTNQKIYVFTLNPKMGVALSGRGRSLDEWEKERIKYHYKININNPGFGNVIDNSNQTPEETANQILKLIK